jgi:hypothetical protein
MVPDRSQQTRADFSSNRPVVRSDFGARPSVQQAVPVPQPESAVPVADPFASLTALPVQTPISIPVTTEPAAVNTTPQSFIAPQPAAVPLASETQDLDSLLQSVGVQVPAPQTKPVPTAPPSAFVSWMRGHKTQLKAGSAVVAVLLTGVFSFNIYHGYTHNTPLVGIAAPKPVALAKSNDHAVVTAASFQEQSADTARQATVKALYDQIEAYYVSKGYYPSNNDMQSLTWIANNFKGFDLTTLKDPDGLTVGLAAKPAAHVYAYQSGVDTHLGACDNSVINCNYYVLTATLSNGEAFTKVALQ